MNKNDWKICRYNESKPIALIKFLLETTRNKSFLGFLLSCYIHSKVEKIEKSSKKRRSTITKNGLGLKKNIGKQKFRFKSPRVFESITKVIKDTNGKVLERSQSTLYAIEEPNDSNMKASDLMNRIECFDGVLVRPSANPIKPESKNEFKLNDDSNCNWYDFTVSFEKNKLQGDAVVSKESGQSFCPRKRPIEKDFNYSCNFFPEKVNKIKNDSSPDLK